MPAFLTGNKTRTVEGDCCCDDMPPSTDCCENTQCDIVAYLLFENAYINSVSYGDIIVPLRRYTNAISIAYWGTGYAYKASDGLVAWSYAGPSAANVGCLDGTVTFDVYTSLGCRNSGDTTDYECDPVSAAFTDFRISESPGCATLEMDDVLLVSGAASIEPAFFTDPNWAFLRPASGSLPAVGISALGSPFASSCASCPCLNGLSATLESPNASAPWGTDLNVIASSSLGCEDGTMASADFYYDGALLDLNVSITGAAGGDFTIEFNRIHAVDIIGRTFYLLCDIVGGSCDGETCLIAVVW